MKKTKYNSQITAHLAGVFPIAVLYILLTLLPCLTRGQWSDDPDNPLIVCNEANAQNSVRALTDNDGGYYVFWIDNRDEDNAAIYGQHFDINGNILWQTNGKSIIEVIGKKVIDFKIRPWQSGFIIAWLQGPSYTDSLFCHYLDTSGAPIWPAPVQIANVDGAILYLDEAGFNVFPNLLGATIGYSYIYTGGQVFFCFNRIDFSGNLAFPINNFDITYGSTYNYRSCSDNQNGIYVLLKGNGIGSDIYIQRYDSSGAAVFPVPVNITAGIGGFAGNISMHSDVSGSLYVTWDGSGLDGIFATKLNPDGSFAWTPFYRDVSDYPSGQSHSNSILTDDKLYITWDDNRFGADNIYIQKLDISGLIEWNPGGVLVSNLSYYIPEPKLVTSDSGSVVVTYEVFDGFYAQKFRPDSTIKFDVNGEPISIPSDPFYEDYELLQGNSGCIIAFWSSDASDIYGARICSQFGVGLQELTVNENRITINPNPSSSGIFEIRIPDPVSEHDVRVIDIFGRDIINPKSGSAPIILDLSLEAKGIYILEVKTEMGIITDKLMIE